MRSPAAGLDWGVRAQDVGEIGDHGAREVTGGGAREVFGGGRRRRWGSWEVRDKDRKSVV